MEDKATVQRIMDKFLLDVNASKQLYDLVDEELNGDYDRVTQGQDYLLEEVL